MPLKYLFTAEFDDGSRIEQDADDKSSFEPETRSRFYDVMQAILGGRKLVSFVLKGDGHEYGVDLRDGHFEIDGIPFWMHEDRSWKGFRIVFFRQHSHHIQVSRAENKEVGHDIVYRVGWQLTAPDGLNYQEIMEFE